MADKKERVSMPTGQNKMKEYLQQSQTGTSKPTVAMPEQEQTSPVQEQTISDGELWNKFLENMIKYTGVKEQGSAVWLPSDVTMTSGQQPSGTFPSGRSCLLLSWPSSTRTKGN